MNTKTKQESPNVIIPLGILLVMWFLCKASNCIFAGILLKSYNRPDKTVNTNAIKYTQSHCNSCHFFIIVFIFYIQSSTHTIPILGL